MHGFSLLLRANGDYNLHGCFRLANLAAVSFVIVILGGRNQSGAELTNLQIMKQRQATQNPTPPKQAAQSTTVPLRQATQSTTVPPKQAVQSAVLPRLHDWTTIKVSGHYTRLNIRTPEGDSLKLSLGDPNLASYFPLLIQNLVDIVYRMGGLYPLSRHIRMTHSSIKSLHDQLVQKKTPPKKLDIHIPRLFFVLNKAQEFLKSHPEHDMKSLQNQMPVSIPTANKPLYLNNADTDKFIENLEPIVDYIDRIVIFLQHNERGLEFSWYTAIRAQNKNIKNNTIEENKHYFSQPSSRRRQFNEFLRRVRELHKVYDPQDVFNGKYVIQNEQKSQLSVSVPTEDGLLYLKGSNVDKFIKNSESVIKYMGCMINFLLHIQKTKQFHWYETLLSQYKQIQARTTEKNKAYFSDHKNSWKRFNRFLKRAHELHQFYDPQEVFRVGTRVQYIQNKLSVRRITPKELLDRFSHDVTKKDLFQRNSLFYAVKTDPLPKIKQLVDRGVAVDVYDVSSESPLEWAIFLGRIDVVQYLWPRVKKPKDTEYRGRLRNKWLKDAVLQGHNEVAAFLLAQGLELHDITWPEVYEYHYIRDRLEFIKWLDVLAERGVFTPPQIEHLTTARAHYIQAFADRYPALARELHNHNSETNAQPAIETEAEADADVGAAVEMGVDAETAGAGVDAATELDADAEAEAEIELERWLAQQPLTQDATDCAQLLKSIQ